MKPTARIFNVAKGGRTPLIHFLGPRKTRTEPHAPHPHYLAPPEAKGAAFEEFLKKLNASGSSIGASSSGTKSAETGAHTYNAFWEVPDYSKFRLSELSEGEIEEVMSGGASSFGR